MEKKQRNTKEGVLEGMIDGLIMKTLWDDKTAEAEKDFSYFLGNVIISTALPGVYICIAADFIRGKYNF